MIIHSDILSLHSVGNPDTAEVSRAPKKALLNAVEAIRNGDTAVEADFHPETGELRIIASSSPNGLGVGRFTTPLAHARATIRTRNFAKALNLGDVQIVDDKVEEFEWGYRVAFSQVQSVVGRRKPLPVRAGHVHVSMDKAGRIFQIVNTLRHGLKPKGMSRLVTRKQAVENAKAKMTEILATSKLATEKAQENSGLKAKLAGAKLHQAISAIDLGSLKTDTRLTQLIAETKPVIDGSNVKVQLVLSAHEDQMDPVYEVCLSVGEPRVFWAFLVHAKTGEVVHNQNLLHFLMASTASADSTMGKGDVKATSTICIPDPKVDINKQTHEVLIKALPDPKVLETEHFVFYAGGTKKKVVAKPDGTFNYSPKEPEYGAVVTAIWMLETLATIVSVGGKAPSKQIPVYCGDASVSDNAYWDPENQEIHIGIGSGLKRGGLREQVSHDQGVAGHEFIHAVITINTPGNDLPGRQGGAMHESIADILGTLGMEYLFRIRHSAALGKTFTLQDIKNDRRVIGGYVLPPDGIRIQRNTKKTPQDEVGEVHDDGLISGGAQADMLEAICGRTDASLEVRVLETLKIVVGALQLVPAHKVLFRDMLRCMITADQNFNAGANRKLIEDAHAAHGIKLASATAKQPVVVVTTTPRRRRRKAS